MIRSPGWTYRLFGAACLGVATVPLPLPIWQRLVISALLVVAMNCYHISAIVMIEARAVRRDADERSVLRVIRQDPDIAGFDLMLATGLNSARLYPVLAALEQRGEIVSVKADDGRRRYSLAGSE